MLTCNVGEGKSERPDPGEIEALQANRGKSSHSENSVNL
jgi:hypothetical protein